MDATGRIVRANDAIHTQGSSDLHCFKHTSDINVRNVFGQVRNIVVILMGPSFPFHSNVVYTSKLKMDVDFLPLKLKTTRVLKKQTLLQFQHKSSQILKYPCILIDCHTLRCCPLR
jgi:hypothetical protein